MSDFLNIHSVTPVSPELESAAFEKFGEAVLRNVAPVAIAALLPEDELNNAPYRVRKALYDYAAQQFVFERAMFTWAEERRRT